MWTVETLNATVDAELEALPDDTLARFGRIRNLIQTHGLDRMPAHYIDHIQGPLWEIRLRGKDGIARALYVTAREQRVVVVRVFVKKTQKTPPREIRLALQRAKEVR